MKTGFSTIRDLTSYLSGLAVVGHEVLVDTEVDPTAVAVGMALVGLPLVLGADTSRQRSGSRDGS